MHLVPGIIVVVVAPVLGECGQARRLVQALCEQAAFPQPSSQLAASSGSGITSSELVSLAKDSALK